MRVIVIGGAGAMGSRAVRTLVGLPGFDEIVVADRDRDAAERLAASLAGRRVAVGSSAVDVTDGSALRAVLTGADLTLNMAGPFYRFGSAVLRAAIDTGVHYLDICDDWEPTLQLLDLDGAARAAGVCAVIGMGASPGVSNLLAAAAAAELDRVDDLFTAWPVDAEAAAAPGQMLGAAAVHWMHQCSGQVAEVRDGRIHHRSPLRPVSLRLPGGVVGTGHTVGHPEPVTLQRTVAPTRSSACLMVIRPGAVAYLDVLRTDIDAGRLTPEAAAELLERPSPLRLLRSIPRALRLSRRGPGTLPPFFAAAGGVVGDENWRVVARLEPPPGEPLFHDMAAATGVPAALAAGQFYGGEPPRPGVHPPEAVIDRNRLFAELAVAFDGARVVIEKEPGCLIA